MLDSTYQISNLFHTRSMHAIILIKVLKSTLNISKKLLLPSNYVSWNKIQLNNYPEYVTSICCTRHDWFAWLCMSYNVCEPSKTQLLYLKLCLFNCYLSPILEETRWPFCRDVAGIHLQNIHRIRKLLMYVCMKLFCILLLKLLLYG